MNAVTVRQLVQTILAQKPHRGPELAPLRDLFAMMADMPERMGVVRLSLGMIAHVLECCRRF